MELHGSYTSPFVRHCRVVALQTQAPMTLVETASPTADNPSLRVPFLIDGDVKLTDSASIVRYLREHAGQRFLGTVSAYDRFCLVNTALDATVNCFVLARDGITAAQSPYLARQQLRVDRILAELEATAPTELMLDADEDLRLVCYLDWAVYRGLVDLNRFPQLAQLTLLAHSDPHMKATEPPK